jgi:hypothetical protein
MVPAGAPTINLDDLCKASDRSTQNRDPDALPPAGDKDKNASVTEFTAHFPPLSLTGTRFEIELSRTLLPRRCNPGTNPASLKELVHNNRKRYLFFTRDPEWLAPAHFQFPARAHQ